MVKDVLFHDFKGKKIILELIYGEKKISKICQTLPLRGGSTSSRLLDSKTKVALTRLSSFQG